MNLTSTLATLSHRFHNDFTPSSHAVLHPVSQRCHIDFKNQRCHIDFKQIPHQSRTNFTPNFRTISHLDNIFTARSAANFFTLEPLVTINNTRAPEHLSTGHRPHTEHRAPAPGTGHRAPAAHRPRHDGTERNRTICPGQP